MKENSHIKIPDSQKIVPQELAVRNKIKRACEKISKELSRENVPNKSALKELASKLLKDCNLEEEYLGYAMVQIGNCFFGEHFASVPFEKRLLLLPHCLRDRKNCQGEYDQVQLQCKGCGSCVLDSFITRAEELGYTTLIAEGTPIVVRILLEKDIEGVLGVSCLTSLERAFKRVQESGIPCLAVPLLIGGCKDTKVDEQEVFEHIEIISSETVARSRKKNIDKLANSIFLKAMETYPNPSYSTETIAKKYILAGGKRIKPFLTVAVYSALSNEADIPEYVYKAALAIELFHKASLIHDDIEDASLLRYGQPTLHHQYNEGVAINIGDFMLGLGYNLLIEIRNKMNPDVHFQLMKIISQAHKNMGVGQGTELLWHLNKNKSITKDDIIDIYEKKTAEAYRASILIGSVMAGASDNTIDALERYSKAFGIAFQINDDLKDIVLREDGTLKSCPEIDKGEPTLLFALSLENLGQKDRKQLLRLMSKKKRTKKDSQKIYDLFVKAGAIDAALQILQKYSDDADQVLLEIKEKSLRTILKKVKERALG